MLNQPDELKHNNPAYPMLDESELRGSARGVADVAARNAIPVLKRKQFALVSYFDGTNNVTKRYKASDLSDAEWQKEANWEELGSGMGLSEADQAKVDNLPENTTTELAGKAATNHTHDYQPTEDGKGLSTMDYTMDDSQKVHNLPENTLLELEGKVDKIPGKGLSTMDYTMDDSQKVHNLPENTLLELEGKVDKIPGKGLSTNDYTTADRSKVNAVTDLGEYYNLDAITSITADKRILSAKVTCLHYDVNATDSATADPAELVYRGATLVDSNWLNPDNWHRWDGLTTEQAAIVEQMGDKGFTEMFPSAEQTFFDIISNENNWIGNNNSFDSITYPLATLNVNPGQWYHYGNYAYHILVDTIKRFSTGVFHPKTHKIILGDTESALNYEFEIIDTNRRFVLEAITTPYFDTIGIKINADNLQYNTLELIIKNHASNTVTTVVNLISENGSVFCGTDADGIYHKAATSFKLKRGVLNILVSESNIIYVK